MFLGTASSSPPAPTSPAPTITAPPSPTYPPGVTIAPRSANASYASLSEGPPIFPPPVKLNVFEVPTTYTALDTFLLWWNPPLKFSNDYSG